MAQLTFKIAAQLESAGFKEAADHMRALEKSAKDASGAGGAVKEAFSDLKGELLGFASVFGVLEFFKSSVDAAAKEEQAMGLLQSKLESQGVEWGKVKGQVDEFTKALSEQTRFSKTETVDAIGRMVDKVHDLGTAEHLVTDAMGLAVARHMDLASASDLVAGLQEKQGRATLQAARMLGLHGSAAKDSAAVLAELHKRFGELAETEDSFESKQKKMANSFEAFKVTVGEGVMPVLAKFFDVLTTGFKVAGPFIEMVLAAILVQFKEWEVSIDSMLSHVPIIGSTFKSALVEAQGSLNELNKAAQESADKFEKVWDAPAKAIPKAMAEGKKHLEASSPELLELIDKFNAASLVRSEANLDAKIAVMRDEEKKQLKHLQDQFGNEEGFAKLTKALHDKTAREITQLQEAESKKRIDAIMKDATKTSELLGVATAKMLSGQKDAWKDALKSMIDMMAQKVEASLAMAAAEAFGHGNIALGLAATVGIGAVAGLAEAAKSAIGSASGGGGSVSAPSAATAPIASNVSEPVRREGGVSTQAMDQRKITINIQGDILADPHFVDRLAEKISAAVENRDVRFVASQVAA